MTAWLGSGEVVLLTGSSAAKATRESGNSMCATRLCCGTAMMLSSYSRHCTRNAAGLLREGGPPNRSTGSSRLCTASSPERKSTLRAPGQINSRHCAPPIVPQYTRPLEAPMYTASSGTSAMRTRRMRSMVTGAPMSKKSGGLEVSVENRYTWPPTSPTPTHSPATTRALGLARKDWNTKIAYHPLAGSKSTWIDPCPPPPYEEGEEEGEGRGCDCCC